MLLRGGARNDRLAGRERGQHGIAGPAGPAIPGAGDEAAAGHPTGRAGRVPQVVDHVPCPFRSGLRRIGGVPRRFGGLGNGGGGLARGGFQRVGDDLGGLLVLLNNGLLGGGQLLGGDPLGFLQAGQNLLLELAFLLLGQGAPELVIGAVEFLRRLGNVRRVGRVEQGLPGLGDLVLVVLLLLVRRHQFGANIFNRRFKQGRDFAGGLFNRDDHLQFRLVHGRAGGGQFLGLGGTAVKGGR